MNPRRLGIIICAFWIGLLCSTYRLDAQVSIKERVPIVPGNTLDRNRRANGILSKSGAFFVAPRTGTIEVDISCFWHYYNPTPDSSYISVVTGDTNYIMSAWKFVDSKSYSNNFAIWNHCTHSYDHISRYWDGTFSEEPLRKLFIPTVAQGDTVWFAYNADSILWASDVQFQYYSDSIWQISFNSGIPNDCRDYGEPPVGCSAYLRYAPTDFSKFRVSAGKDTLKSGESTSLVVVAVNDQDEEVDLNGASSLDFTADSSAYVRFFSVPGDTTHRPSPFSNVRYADARDGAVQVVADGDKPERYTKVGITAKLENDTTKRGADTVVLKPPTILLGETKYYRARYTGSPAKLKIEELSAPTLGGVSGVWADDCVSIVNGEKVGVYWERRDADGDLLDNSLIRVIGIRWKPGQKYVVRLTAKDGSNSASIDIETVKPTALGDTYRLTKDVRDSIISVDSLCILYGGEYGVPPQILKAQIQEEAPVIHFGSFDGFAPSYRYEPLTLQQKIEEKARWKTNQAYVTSTSMGSVAIPDHQHLMYISYPREVNSTWWYIVEYSDLVQAPPPGGIRLYAKLDNGRMDFASYGNITVQKKVYNPIIAFFKGKKSTPSTTDYSNARDSTIVNLMDVWNGDGNGNKGLNNNSAQTRIAASYGLIQMTFPDAISSGYPENDPSYPPEFLNCNGILFPLVMALHQTHMRSVLGSQVNKSDNWAQGFEAKMQELVKLWNPKKAGYDTHIMAHALNYLPIP